MLFWGKNAYLCNTEGKSQMKKQIRYPHIYVRQVLKFGRAKTIAQCVHISDKNVNKRGEKTELHNITNFIIGMYREFLYQRSYVDLTSEHRKMCKVMTEVRQYVQINGGKQCLNESP